MTALSLHGEKVETVFDIVGNNENAMTNSLAWALSQSKHFLNLLAQNLGIENGFSEHVAIHLQEHKSEKGFTDLEIIDPNVAHIIIEAKRGFTIPTNEQLEKYADRLHASNLQGKKLLVVLAESDRKEKWLSLNTPKEIKGIEIQAISWRQFQNLAEQSIQHGTHAEKRLLRDLKQYLGKTTTMQNQYSNQVFVVSLSDKKFPNSDITFINVVEKYSKYFHPVGGGRGGRSGWPTEPPNYIAFRYHGILQKVHHIESYTIIEDYHPHFPVPNPSPTGGPHFLYELGPAIRPNKKITTNDAKKRFLDVARASRCRCFLDLLLTSDSISEAFELSKQRITNLEQNQEVL